MLFCDLNFIFILQGRMRFVRLSITYMSAVEILSLRRLIVSIRSIFLLSVNSHVVFGMQHDDTDVFLFEAQIAVDRSFTKGRRTTHVAAACLYIACRYAIF